MQLNNNKYDVIVSKRYHFRSVVLNHHDDLMIKS